MQIDRAMHVAAFSTANIMNALGVKPKIERWTDLLPGAKVKATSPTFGEDEDAEPSKPTPAGPNLAAWDNLVRLSVKRREQAA